jgi:energy-coupling factor transporter ATP-binding protein EcfA2
MDDNAIIFQYPALPVKIQDNEFVDKFIDTMFGQYAEFVKNWMALYAYTNHTKLPVLVLTGSRGCGKNTFAEMVGGIFPTLMGLWEGTKERFNEYYKNKLLFVDENPNADKPMQYTEIKKLTGNKILRIDEKFIPAYNTLNNLNIIIATNDPRPMFLKAREEPKSENLNNFFIYKCPDVDPDVINNALGDQLQDRLGHYVRSELKTRYARLMAQLNTNSRYALSAPITQLARDLFGSAVTTVESEAEELAQYLVCGVNMPDSRNSNAPNICFTPHVSDGHSYVRLNEIRDLVDRLHFKGNSNYKVYIAVMQDLGVLSYKQVRESGQRFGYHIQRTPDYYTTTVSGVLPVTGNNARSKSAVLEMPSTSRSVRVFE